VKRPCIFPFALSALALALHGGTALGQDAVRDAVRELEEAEARLGGGIYQVPLRDSSESVEPAKKSAEKGTARREKKAVKEGAPHGIDIGPAEEKGSEQGRALGEVAARLAALQEREGDLRARIVRLQDDLAARLDDVGYASVFLVVKEPGGQALPLGLHEVAANLDGVPLVSRFRPRRIEREMKVPLYEGPLPAGDYDLHVRLVIGLQSGPWPLQAGQGRWLVENTLKFHHAPKRTSKGVEAQVLLVPSDGNARPTLTIDVREVR